MIGLIGMVSSSLYTTPVNLSVCHVSPIEKIIDMGHLNYCVAHLTFQQLHELFFFPSLN